ncbi:MAG: hypothetical protein V4805_18825 [Pseudomonadota bacterium]
MRKRILYVMHVDWDWIKQRPHFIAQHLSLSHDLLVAFPWAKNRAILSKNSRGDFPILPFLRMPVTGLPLFSHAVNRTLLRLYFRITIRWFCPDFVWLTSPELFDYFPKNTPVRFIYDCMDDALGFEDKPSKITLLRRLEIALLDKSFHTIVSSNDLAKKIHARARCQQKCTVIHNAFEENAAAEQTSSRPNPVVKKTGVITIGYIGTISAWFDFDALLACANRFKNVEVHLIGPVDRVNIPSWRHGQIHFHGPVPHGALAFLAQSFDILIMPFKVCDLVRSVDPIKLYEYILFDKPIIAVRYAEIERFDEFVSFYSTHHELISTLEALIDSGCKQKYSTSARQIFLEKNSWASRASQIQNALGWTRDSEFVDIR